MKTKPIYLSMLLGMLAMSPMLSMPAFANASALSAADVQRITVSGTVVDEAGEPIIGASVLVKEENRSYFVDGCHAAALTTSNVTDKDDYVKANDGWNLGMNTYYLSNPGLEVSYSSTEDEMTNWTWDKLPAEDEAILEKIGVSGQFERALHFILNEQTRELVGELVRWEHMSRTMTIHTRCTKLNPDIIYFDKDKHYYRPIPQTFLDNMQNEDGTNLSDEQKAAWQNRGY